MHAGKALPHGTTPCKVYWLNTPGLRNLLRAGHSFGRARLLLPQPSLPGTRPVSPVGLHPQLPMSSQPRRRRTPRRSTRCGWRVTRSCRRSASSAPSPWCGPQAARLVPPPSSSRGLADRGAAFCGGSGCDCLTRRPRLRPPPGAALDESRRFAWGDPGSDKPTFFS